MICKSGALGQRSLRSAARGNLIVMSTVQYGKSMTWTYSPSILPPRENFKTGTISHT